MLVSFSLLFGKMDPWRQDLSHWIKQQTRKKHLWHFWNKHCGQFLFTQYVSMNHISMYIQSDCRFIRIGIVVQANSVLTGVLPDTFLLAIWWRFPEIGGTTQIIYFSIGFSWIFHEINILRHGGTTMTMVVPPYGFPSRITCGWPGTVPPSALNVSSRMVSVGVPSVCRLPMADVEMWDVCMTRMNLHGSYGGFHEWGVPKMDGLQGKKSTKMDDLEVALIQETTIWIL